MICDKILSAQKLLQFIQRERRKNPKAKFVFTNGCFDILHPGHVQYLEKASQLGTHLIVALNSDASVKKLKGPTRPLQPLKDRLQVIAALQSASLVTWFGEETPLKIISLLKPDVLVKGADYKLNEIVGANVVLASGGKVLTVKLVRGKSTTSIAKKLKQK